MIRTHPYRYLFYAGMINSIGDRFSQVAVLALILKLTGSGLAVGAALGVRILPYLLLSPLAGRLADRFHKKWLMVATDFARIPFAVCFLWVDSTEQLWIVFLGVIALSCGEAFYQPVRKSAIATIVEKDRLLQVNGWEQVLLGIGLIGGSITGGIVAYLFGSSFAFILNGISFFCAAILLLPLKMNGKSEKTEQRQKAKHFQWEKWLIFAIFLQLLGVTMDGAFNVLISVYGAETFQLGELGVGLLYGALGTGMVLSFFLSSKLKVSLLPLFMSFLVAEGVLHVLASMTTFFPLMWLLFLLIALSGGTAAAVLDTFLMKRVADESQGRVFGWVETWTNVHFGIMMFASGIMLEVVSPRVLGFCGGLSGIIVGMVAIFIYVIINRER